MDKSEVEEIQRIAIKEGWDAVPFCRGGPICRWCHKEIIAFGITMDAWKSPKGGFYHKYCAVERFLSRLRLRKKRGK